MDTFSASYHAGMVGSFVLQIYRRELLGEELLIARILAMSVEQLQAELRRVDPGAKGAPPIDRDVIVGGVVGALSNAPPTTLKVS